LIAVRFLLTWRGCPEGVLEKLNLPVALKVELERIGKLPFELPQFFHAVTDATATDSRFQIKAGSDFLGFHCIRFLSYRFFHIVEQLCFVIIILLVRIAFPFLFIFIHLC
jgi:hypothetical protein